MYNGVDCPNYNAKMYTIKLLIFSSGNNLYLAANSVNADVMCHVTIHYNLCE